MLTSDATPEFRNQAFDYRSCLHREPLRFQQRMWHKFQAEQNRLLGIASQQSLAPLSQLSPAGNTTATTSSSNSMAENCRTRAFHR